MRRLARVVLIVVVVLVVVGVVIYALLPKQKKPGTVLDEAQAAGYDVKNPPPKSLPPADEDYFAGMDYGLSKNPEAVRAALDPYWPGIKTDEAVRRFVRGRNNWNVWTGGNDAFWDRLSVVSFGTIDLLKTISSYPGRPDTVPYGRWNRWEWLGLINEPCFAPPPKGGRKDRFGLYLDVRVCGSDPFEDEHKYPGVKWGARGKNIPVGSLYGYSTGVLGLRLFPNPNFDEAAQKKWNPVRYYTDPSYYNDRNLVKPYRVGMSCGFCHISFNPSNPPAHPDEPEWQNISSNPGAQYFWVDRIFVWRYDPSNFFYELFHTSRPGALDTSFVSSDQINNPRTMNAIYHLGARMHMATFWGEEQLAGGELENKQFQDYTPPIPANSPLGAFWNPATQRTKTPRVLKDGADSVGALGALNRVYINIGLFSEEWMLHFMPLIGGTPLKPISPIPIATAEKNSAYWRATESQSPDVALFFLASSQRDKIPDDQITRDAAQLTRGKEVFAERCARCHSSKLPPRAYSEFFQLQNCGGQRYLQCWNDYWQWTKTADFKNQMKAIVIDPNFADANNALTNDVRVPFTLLETNAGSPLATNAIAGDIWDNFASQTYKNLPSVGTVKVQNPYTGAVSDFTAPGGGRGFTRPPSLVSIWSTAPFLVNNSLGKFDGSGTVQGRLASFDDSIHKLLWPERREGGETVVTRSGKLHPGWVDRLPQKAYIKTDVHMLPAWIRWLPGSALGQAMPNFFHNGNIQIGPLPKGMPINLLSNVDLSKPKLQILGFAISFLRYLEQVPPDASDEDTAKAFAPLVPKMLALSKNPDFVVNKGHYFGTDYLPAGEGEPGLSDSDKNALIEFLKTL